MSGNNFDYQFGVSEIIPSKQSDVKEGARLSDFRKVIDDSWSRDVNEHKAFPSDKEVFVFILQFFISKAEYSHRDVDNMSKTILDSLKGKLYSDDSQVRTLLISKKIYNRVPKNFAFVGIKEIKGETDVEVVRATGMEQAVTLYQRLAKENVI